MTKHFRVGVFLEDLHSFLDLDKSLLSKIAAVKAAITTNLTSKLVAFLNKS